MSEWGGGVNGGGSIEVGKRGQGLEGTRGWQAAIQVWMSHLEVQVVEDGGSARPWPDVALSGGWASLPGECNTRQKAWSTV